MKRFTTALLAAALAMPVITPVNAVAHERGRDRHWDRHDDDDWRDDRRHYRRGYREGRRDSRHWRRHEHNGYWYRERWYYGPPPVAYYDDPYYRPGWRAWRRGDRLPPYYRSHYVVVRDYDYYDLPPPRRGYHYVRDDRGDILLVGIATGVILGVILANH
jgi:Ni/Co efflux regulator RcnB